jgi:hypothetical protein
METDSERLRIALEDLRLRANELKPRSLVLSVEVNHLAAAFPKVLRSELEAKLKGALYDIGAFWK